jgi:4a-hydroxytetrahydrobiopterin dehydratase
MVSAWWKPVNFPQVVLTTHAAGGLSMQDFIMAARIDALSVEYSPKWRKAQEKQ